MQTSIVDILKKYRTLVSEQAILEHEIERLNQQLQQNTLRRSAIKEELDELENKISELEKIGNNVIAYENESVTATSNGTSIPEGYNVRFPNIKKAAYVLKEKGRCLPIRGIVDRILEIENRVDDKDYDRKLVGSISSTLSTKAKKRHHVSRYQEFDGGEQLYGLNQWFDDNTPPNPLKGYERVL